MTEKIVRVGEESYLLKIGERLHYGDKTYVLESYKDKSDCDFGVYRWGKKVDTVKLADIKDLFLNAQLQGAMDKGLYFLIDHSDASHNT